MNHLAYLMLVCLTLFSVSVYANNIAVSNVSLTNLDEGAGEVDVQFDVSWDNSWRVSSGPSNWDAAWIFVKYRASSGDWMHAILSTTVPAQPAGGELKVSPDQVGAVIYRSEDGSGSVNFSDVRITWAYPSDVNTSDIIDIQVHAIEMVYVPEGAFVAGDLSSIGAFYEVGSPDKGYYTVGSEDAITVSNSVGNFYYDSDGDQLGPIPAGFPKGFGAFYCMKYEITQDQWVNFFNTLPVSLRDAVDITGVVYKSSDDPSFRNTIAWTGGSASATTASPNLPCGFLDASLFMAYLDWSGLRPMTELEFEKACRGTLPARDGQYAWGSININTEEYALTNVDTPFEGIGAPAVGTGNAYTSATNDPNNDGPVRVGAFAASAINKNREETGATIYGIMEMSGNQWELTVTVGNPTGRGFMGNHGNGSVGITNDPGFHDVADWPANISGVGLGFRGGSYRWAASYAVLADRTFAALAVSVEASDYTGRGVRTDF